MSGFPPMAELVPHAGPMRLLERVVGHDAHETRCSVDLAASRLFRRADGSVPAWLGLEYMAQCAAAHGGLAARARGEAGRPGLLLGSRRVRFHVDHFAPGQALLVTARHHRGQVGLVAFDCRVQDAGGERSLAEGRIGIYVFRDWKALEEQVHA